MTHDAIRAAIDRKAKEVTVPVSLASLMALIEERDALERDLLMERELAQINRNVDGIKTVEVKAVECTCTDPPTVYEVTTIERADGSIEGGWDMGSAESYTAVEVVEPPAGDCSCKAPVAPVFPSHPKVAALAQDIERAVCGSRQPVGQVTESPAPLSVLKDRPFLSDKGSENPSKTVVPWSSKLTPNQTALIIRMLGEGANGVTAAANARCLTQHVGGVMAHYRHQIEALSEIEDQREREKFLDSLYRQMLARWVAAGNNPAIQPEAPLPNKTITEAAKPDKPSQGRN